ncbi:hypothetical protein KIN20_019716 [Parelaphostrongylus tenuis]|uniref:Uncharacterized protein n=1 Tax=Parelaphostrongylus tenuis TaxID=148309 RepID=A0AAD5QSM9_PARTN|nr:hypothetical protein KIN20_019716 [Parelaphostrongylus tenuis]
MRSRELTLEEMLRCPRDETKSIDEYQARLQDLLSEIHKEEQLCEDLMAAKELQSKEIASLSEKIDDKIESARELLEKELCYAGISILTLRLYLYTTQKPEKQLLTEKKEAIQYVFVGRKCQYS